MRSIVYHVLLCMLVATFSFTASAHTYAQTNSLIRSMLRSSLVRPNYDVQTQAFKTLPQTIISQEEFFAQDEYWTEQEKRGAFDWYLGNLSSTAVECGVVAGRLWSDNPIACAAIAQCESMSYTNALPILISNISKEFDQSRISSIRTAISWSPVNSNLNEIVEGVVTNNVFYTANERNTAYRCFCSKLCEISEEDNESGVDLIYRQREDPIGAVAIDKVLVRQMAGYSNSVVRIECALSLLSNNQASATCINYFSNVTNALYRADDPINDNEQ